MRSPIIQRLNRSLSLALVCLMLQGCQSATSSTTEAVLGGKADEVTREFESNLEGTWIFSNVDDYKKAVATSAAQRADQILTGGKGDQRDLVAVAWLLSRTNASQSNATIDRLMQLYGQDCASRLWGSVLVDALNGIHDPKLKQQASVSLVNTFLDHLSEEVTRYAAALENPKEREYAIGPADTDNLIRLGAELQTLRKQGFMHRSSGDGTLLHRMAQAYGRAKQLLGEKSDVEQMMTAFTESQLSAWGTMTMKAKMTGEFSSYLQAIASRS